MIRAIPVAARSPWSAVPWLAVLFLAGLAGGTWRNVQFARAHAESLAVYNLGVDAATYEEAAQRFARRPRARLLDPSQPPGFVAMLGLLHRAFGTGRLPIKLVFCSLVAATALLAWWIGSRWDPLWGVIAGLLIAWSPLLQAYAATLQYEVPAAFLCTASLALLVAMTTARGSLGPGVLVALTALVCAVSALTREVLVVLFPILIASIAWRHDLPRRQQALLAGLAFGLYAAIVGGWIGYQSARSGRLVPISDKGRVNLQIGNNPNANGTYNLLAASVAQPAGFAFMRADPAGTAVLFGRKALYFTGLLKDGWNVPRPAALWTARATWNVLSLDAWLLLFRGGGVFALALVGIVLLATRTGPPASSWPLAAAVGGVFVVHVVTLSSHRFSVPVWPAAALLAAIPVVRAWRAAPRSHVALASLLVLGGVWGIAAQSIAPPGRYTRAATELDGDRVTNVSDALSSRGLVRLGAAAGGRRMIAIDTAELIGRGFLAVRFGVRATLPEDSAVPEPGTVVADVLVSDEAGHIICASGLTWTEVETGRFQPFTTGCRLPEDTVLSVALWTRAVADLRVDSFTLSFGHRRPEDVTPPRRQAARLPSQRARA